MNLSNIISRFRGALPLIKKTVLRSDKCYYKRDYHFIVTVDNECVYFKYSPNKKITHHITIDYKTNNLHVYSTKITGIYNQHSAPFDIKNYNSLHLASTEEGYFMQSTVQNLYDLELFDIESILELKEHFVNSTNEYRNTK